MLCIPFNSKWDLVDDQQQQNASSKVMHLIPHAYMCTYQATWAVTLLQYMHEWTPRTEAYHEH
eukprot:scaffold280974_cov14-Tisochrysis_lutea.AAC.1